MHCPFCPAQDTKVIDSRLVEPDNQVRRRRECLECGERFTSYEIAELAMPRVIKSNGARVLFEARKLKEGMLKALEKRPVSMEAVENALKSIMRKLREMGEAEVHSYMLGDEVMEALLKMDKVAYIRFASVYRSFEDVDAFRQEIRRLLSTKKEKV